MNQIIKNKSILALSLIPLIFLIFAVYKNVQVEDTDALAYHLYYARVINELGLNFFSKRPVLLDNSLGFGLSAHFPWLYSHIIASLTRFTGFSYDNSSYVFSAILYLLLLIQFEDKFKPLLILFFMIPQVYGCLFLHGTNYLLTITLGFFTYKSLTERQGMYSDIKSLMFGILLIFTHVFGIFIISMIVASEVIFKRRVHLYVGYLLCLTIYLFNNHILTGSATFPFLQNLFPHANYNPLEWQIVTDQLKREIRSEIRINNIPYILAISLFSIISLRSSLLSKENKFIVTFFMIPTFLIINLGFRHRILFLSIAVLITLLFFQRYKVTPANLIIITYKYIKKNVEEFLVYGAIFITAFLFGYIIFFQLHKSNNISIDDVKSCFYDEISRYSETDRILFSEIELMRISNPRNILPIDGKNYSEIIKLKSDNDFVEYLKNHKIKYITDTPLVSKTRFYEQDAYKRFFPTLIASGKLHLVKDCVYETSIPLSELSKIHPDQLINWKIYKFVP
jgi:hypothetical protein